MNYGLGQIDAFRKATGDLAAIARRKRWIP
jgi:hypothetical protein